MMGSIIVMWLAFGLLHTVCLTIGLSDRVPPEQNAALCILAVLFLPLVLAGYIIFLFYNGIPFLGRGFAGLTLFLPKRKVKLPKAVALSKYGVQPDNCDRKQR